MSRSAEVLADSPVAYYRCGDSSGTVCTDSSGNGRNGTYVGAPTLGVAGLTGDADTAVTLDGNTQEFTTGTSGFSFTTDATIEFWYVGTDGPEVRDNSSASGVGWAIGATGASWSLRIAWTQTWVGPSSAPVKDGLPHFIQLRATATTVTLFVDGVNIWSTNARTNTNTAQNPWHIGRNGTNTGTANYYLSLIHI